MKAFQFAVILTIPCDNFRDARLIARDIVNNIDTDLDLNGRSDIGIHLENEYERDGSELNQRVIYLHNEEDPIELD